MTEKQVGFLVNATFSLKNLTPNPVHNLLRSYYLMRCSELTKGFGLPEKYFSSKVRCSRCFLEWNKSTEVKVHSIRHSKEEKKRKKTNTKNKKILKKDMDESSRCNQIDQICQFCKHVTTTTYSKPPKPSVTNRLFSPILPKPVQELNVKKLVKTNLIGSTNGKVQQKDVIKKVDANVYTKTNDVFSLSNKNNTLQSTIKIEKVIKNNKRKKDKFAGLCQQAVVASAKLKEEKKKQNSLHLFLKPSL